LTGVEELDVAPNFVAYGRESTISSVVHGTQGGELLVGVIVDIHREMMWLALGTEWTLAIVCSAASLTYSSSSTMRIRSAPSGVAGFLATEARTTQHSSLVSCERMVGGHASRVATLSRNIQFEDVALSLNQASPCWPAGPEPLEAVAGGVDSLVFMTVVFLRSSWM